MLRAVVGSNSAVAIPPREYQFFDRLGPAATLEPLDKTEALRELLTWPKVRAWGLTDADIKPFLPRGNSVQALYAAPLLAYARRMGKPRFGEKTPYLELQFHVLLDWFGPSMRFIHLIRDPLETYRSVLHYAQFGKPPTLEEYCGRWTLSLLTGLAWSRRLPHNYFLLRYEDFIHDPVRWTEAICDFAGLPQEIERMLAMEHFARKQNSSFAGPEGQRRFQIAVPNLAERPPLAAEAVQIIESKVFPYAAAIGYKPGVATVS